jgi:outer membrane protein
MKLFLRAFLVVAAIAPLCLWGEVGEVRAGTGEPPVILIIDMDKIRRDASGFRSLQSQMDDRRSAYQSKLQVKEQELREADLELSQQRTILSASAFSQKRKELERQIAALQQDVRQTRASMEALFKEGMAKLQKVLVEIVAEIARERDADLVLTKSQVVLVKPELEITDQALERLNEKLPSVALDRLEQ